MENQVQLNSERIELLNKFKEAVPQFMAAEAEVVELAYKEGALSTKIKRLIAMAVALKVGCTNCILAQTEKDLAEELRSYPYDFLIAAVTGDIQE
mgnify:CR=1 FL=1